MGLTALDLGVRGATSGLFLMILLVLLTLRPSNAKIRLGAAMTIGDRVYYGAVLAFNARRSTFACVVRNFSGCGAKVEFEGAPLLPDHLDFSIARRDLARRARLVWRGHQSAGLVFADVPLTPGVLSLDLARKLRDGERTNKLLRARLEQLLSVH